MQNCINLNNFAVQLFEKGDFRYAAGVYKETLEAFKLAMLGLGQLPSPSTPMHEHGGPPCRPVHRWTQNVRVKLSGNKKEDVFVFSRAVHLCPGSYTHSLQDYYATFILYNIALCYHVLSMTESSALDDYYLSAHSLYNMAFEAMKLTTCPDKVLLVVLFNNCGQLLYRQWRTFEAVKCFKVVQDLMSNISMSVFEAEDFNGMCLNSLMDSNTASAA